MDELEKEHQKLDNRVRFVTEIISGKLVIQNRKKKDLLKELIDRNYDPIVKKKTSSVEPTEGAEEDENDQGDVTTGSYDYLLSMPLWNLTWEKVQSLINEKASKESEISTLLGKSAVALWRTDLEQFIQEWDVSNTKLRYLKKKWNWLTLRFRTKKRKLVERKPKPRQALIK